MVALALVLGWLWEEVNELPVWQDDAFFSVFTSYTLVCTVALVYPAPPSLWTPFYNSDPPNHLIPICGLLVGLRMSLTARFGPPVWGCGWECSLKWYPSFWACMVSYFGGICVLTVCCHYLSQAVISMTVLFYTCQIWTLTILMSKCSMSHFEQIGEFFLCTGCDLLSWTYAFPNKKVIFFVRFAFVFPITWLVQAERLISRLKDSQVLAVGLYARCNSILLNQLLLVQQLYFACPSVCFFSSSIKTCSKLYCSVIWFLCCAYYCCPCWKQALGLLFTWYWNYINVSLSIFITFISAKDIEENVGLPDCEDIYWPIYGKHCKRSVTCIGFMVCF